MSKKFIILSSNYKNRSKTDENHEDSSPRNHWEELSKLSGAEIHSWHTVKHEYNFIFRYIFDRMPLWGLAISVYFNRKNIDRIYALDEDTGLKIAILLKLTRWTGVFICLTHNISYRRKLVIKLLNNKVINHYITYCSEQKKSLIKAGVSPESITATAIPTDTIYFNNYDSKPLRSRHKILMAIGAASRDYESLIKAAPQIEGEIEILGHGYAGPNVVSMSNFTKPENVTFVEHLNVKSLRDRLKNAYLVVLTLEPVNYAAGATVLVEAMSSGLPVIATNTKGLQDYISDTDIGGVVRPYDSNGISCIANELLSNPTRAQQAGDRNRQWIEKNAKIESLACFINHLANKEESGKSRIKIFDNAETSALTQSRDITFIICITRLGETNIEEIIYQIRSVLRVANASVFIGIDRETEHSSALIQRVEDLGLERVTIKILNDSSLYDAWNKSLDYIGTPYISFLGYGDMIVNKNFYEHFRMNGYDVLFSRVLIQGQSSNRIFGSKFNKRINRFRQTAAFIGAIFDINFVRKYKFNKDFKIVGDYEFLCRTSSKIRHQYNNIITCTMSSGGISENNIINARLESRKIVK